MTDDAAFLNDDRATAVVGWAVLELMGHRRIGGYVTEVTLAGAGMLRIDVPSYCEGGPAAAWCPEHGDCTCGKPHDACEGGDLCRCNPECALHSASSRHGAPGCEITATQFYSPSALYCLTPTTEVVARRERPRPFVRYEQRRALQPAPGPFAAADDAVGDVEVEDPTCAECGAPPGHQCADTCSRYVSGEEPTPDSQADGHRER